jgi:hypothetical protein
VRHAPARAEAGVHLVVGADLVRDIALEVIRKAVEIDPELARMGKAGTAQQETYERESADSVRDGPGSRWASATA